MSVNKWGALIFICCLNQIVRDSLALADGSEVGEQDIQNGDVKNEQRKFRKAHCDVALLLSPDVEVFCLGTDDTYIDFSVTGYEVDVGTKCIQQCPLTETCEDHKCTILDMGTWTGRLLECRGGTKSGDSQKEKMVREKRFWWIASLAIGLGVAICIIFCGPDNSDGNYDPPDTTPPQIMCPATTNPVSPIPAKMGERTAVVSWSGATASDNDGATPTINQLAPVELSGSRFGPGEYEVCYLAKDSTGNPNTCRFFFNVYVIECPFPKYPIRGSLNCDYNTGWLPVWGNECKFSCEFGFEMTGTDKQTCGADGQWSDGGKITCERKKCPTPVSPMNGYLSSCSDSDGYMFETICAFRCNDGFILPVNVRPFVTCLGTGTWDFNQTDCVDAAPPVISGCPRPMIAYTDRGSKTATVTWTEPTVTDNLDASPSVTLTQGLPPGSPFPLTLTAPHIIEYTATDAAGNKAVPCHFSIFVLQLTCPSIPATNRLTVDCPDLVYGSTCSFRCQNGYSLIGDSAVTCEKTDTTPPTGFWNWMNDSVPYCQEVKCSNLSVPINGALAYDTWLNGQTATMFCNDQYDIPRGAPSNGLYVCDTTDGFWIPTDNVPDCTALMVPGSLRLPSSLYYFSGDCTTASAQIQIRNQFIQILSQSPYSSLCIDYPECTASNVEVQCGAVGGRKRRELHERQRRGTHEIKVTWDFKVGIKQPFPTDAQAFWSEYDGVLNSMFAQVRQEVLNGAFNMAVGGITLEADVSRYSSEWSALECPKGTQPNEATLSCQSCPIGTFYNETADDCSPCPRGTYQEADGQLSCLSCPAGNWTATSGCKMASDCKDECPSGTYSFNGVRPCSSCDAGTYQSGVHQVSCLTCPVATTSLPGSVKISDCQSFQLSLKSTSQSRSIALLNIKSFTASWWILTKDYSDSAILSIDSTMVSFAIRNPSSLVVLLASEQFESGVNISDGRWHHVVVRWSGPGDCAVVVYLDGTESGRKSFTGNTICNLDVELPVNITLGGSDIDSMEGHVSGVTFWQESQDDAWVMTQSQSCVQDDSGALLRWTDWVSPKLTSSIDIQIDSPSTCNDGNDCDPDPCNGHPCEDLILDYRCRCERGYEGRQCETPPDHCATNACKNGASCVNDLDQGNYTCQCEQGYSGIYCQRIIVNGAWGNWSEWTPCSKSCDSGSQTRQRSCDSPSPDPDGKPCAGNAVASRICNADPCPFCESLVAPPGAILDCYDESVYQKCSLECQDGKAFETPPLDSYMCGPVTSFVWSHRLLDPPKSLPACHTAAAPISYDLSTLIAYSVSDCDEQTTNAIKENGKSFMANNSRCVASGKCDSDSRVSDCPKRRRREVGETQVILTMEVSVTLDSAGVMLTPDVANGTVQDAGEELVEVLTDLEGLAAASKDAVNNGTLSVDVDGKTYTALVSSLSQTGTVACPPGMESKYGVCVNCGPGSYSRDGKACLPCDKGQYQDTEGQTSCLNCPQGTSTETTGADRPGLCTGIYYTKSIPATGLTLLLTATSASAVEDTAEGHSVAYFALIGGLSSAALLIVVSLAIFGVHHYHAREKRKIWDESLQDKYLYNQRASDLTLRNIDTNSK